MVTLSTGRVIESRFIGENCERAMISAGPELSHTEWMEYCDLVRAHLRAQDKAAKAARLAASKAAFANRKTS